MANILVSACLLGHKVRYNGKNLAVKNDHLQQLFTEHNMLHFCPEVAANLPIPRPPAEIQQADGERVIDGLAIIKTQSGKDITAAFLHGAQLTLEYCKIHHIKYAILTESSPSCGSNNIYDGTFSSTKIAGQGVTSALLRQHGIEVFNQFNIEQLRNKLRA